MVVVVEHRAHGMPIWNFGEMDDAMGLSFAQEILKKGCM